MNSVTTTEIASAAGLVFEPGAAEFCESHGLMAYVEIAAKMAARHYKLGGSIAVEIETDPDADEENVVLVIPVLGGSEETFDQYDAYTREWVGVANLNMRPGVSTFIHTVGPANESA